MSDSEVKEEIPPLEDLGNCDIKKEVEVKVDGDSVDSSFIIEPKVSRAPGSQSGQVTVVSPIMAMASCSRSDDPPDFIKPCLQRRFSSSSNEQLVASSLSIVGIERNSLMLVARKPYRSDF